MAVRVDESLDGIDWVQAKADLAADDFDNGRSPQALRASFDRSQHVAIARDGDRVVGMARLLSDGVCNAYLLDVWTMSAYRRQGIGATMVRQLMSRVPGQHIGLQTDNAEAFYASIGYCHQPVFMSAVVGEWLSNEANASLRVHQVGRSLTTLPDNRATSEAREGIRRQLRRSLECLVGVHFTEGNAITVLRNGDEIFPAMLEAIRKAQHTVDLMTFVYWKGRPAQQFADALCDRAKAGLRVRVLIDALGGIQIEDGIVEAMEDAGVDVHWYRRLWLNSPFKQNHRGHRKVCIIDETIGFTGGMGIAKEWEGDARNENEWRDTHFRVEGPAVDGLAAAFIQDWAETGRPLYDERDRFPDQPQPGTAAVQVVRGSASIGWNDIRTVWYVLIRSAQHRIRLQTAYFSPDSDLIAALKEAVSRGVDVDILLPGPNADKRVAQLASEGTYAELISAGIRIWNFQPSMLHTKIMVVDGGAALVGSSNVNRRSLEHDEEVAMVVIDQASVDLLDHQFTEDLQRSRQIDLSRWQRRSAPQRTLETAVTAIRRWL